MALSQSSLFDFDNIPAEKNEEQTYKKLKPLVVKEPKVVVSAPVEEIVVEEIKDITEVNFTEKKHSTKQQGKSTRGRKSIQEMNASVDLVEVPEDEILFQKSYYSIGAVAQMFKVNQSLLRFWENEFDVLKPKKNGKGDRLFRPEDIKNLQLIHHLMRERKYTMEGAKDYLKNSKKAEQKFAMIESLKKLRGFLYELKVSI